ncbi:MAG: SDR family oxidoreductase [Hyphomicrobiales bacterium]|nr:MAG: SDR family oxidoreductase [Hyphomicrobiales bacterium]
MGRAQVHGFHAEGASVVIADVLRDEGQRLAQDLGDRALFVPLDVRDPAGWNAAVDRTEEQFGAISVLINNAAITEGPDATVDRCEPDRWRNVIEVNLIGPYLGIHAVTPSLRRAGGGAIVSISSVRGFSGAPGRSAYSASKWGLRGLTKSAAIELGPDKIRVNSIHPGMIDTPLHKAAPERYRRLPLGRVGEPTEVTRMTLFAASDDASYTTGSEFIVDGGFLLGDL